MSRTRNQRRRDRSFEKIVAAGMFALLLVLLAMLAKQCADIEQMQRTINERAQVTVARTEDFCRKDLIRAAPSIRRPTGGMTWSMGTSSGAKRSRPGEGDLRGGRYR